MEVNSFTRKMNKQITMRTGPRRILEQFKDVFAKGGSINLTMGDGDFIYGVGAQPNTILCKIQNGKHYSYQRNVKGWVEL